MSDRISITSFGVCASHTSELQGCYSCYRTPSTRQPVLAVERHVVQLLTERCIFCHSD